MQSRASELKNSSYELFIGALSILSIANIILAPLTRDPNVADVLYIMDALLSLIFLGDFLFRLFTAESKSGYFFRKFGWADLLASLPFPQAKLLRIFRIVRVARLMREYGAANMAREFATSRGSSALLTLMFLIVLLLEFGGLAMLSIEIRSDDANIKNASDALWYVFVTITTVGYGDRFPVTSSGRILGLLIMTAGVGLFGTLTGFLANAFLANPAADDEDTASAADADPATLLAEVKRLLDKQAATQAEITATMAALEDRLATIVEQTAATPAAAGQG
jgi:voltage-gated potassium channel